jgi:hypothetical protein
MASSTSINKDILSEFRRRNIHRNDDKFNALMCCIADLYVVLLLDSLFIRIILDLYVHTM